MGSPFTTREQQVLAALKRMLGEAGAGVTLYDHHLCVRLTEGSVDMVISDVEPESQRIFSCALCASRRDLAPALLVITHQNGDKTEKDVMTCWDCRDPQ